MAEFCPNCIFFKICSYRSQIEDGDPTTNLKNAQALAESVSRSDCPNKDSVLKSIEQIASNRFPNSNPNLLK